MVILALYTPNTVTNDPILSGRLDRFINSFCDKILKLTSEHVFILTLPIAAKEYKFECVYPRLVWEYEQIELTDLESIIKNLQMRILSDLPQTSSDTDADVA